MTTFCSSCGADLTEYEAKENDTFISCKRCHKFTPKGASSYYNNNKREVKNMTEIKEVKEKKKGKTIFCKCCKCGKEKFCRADVYEKRLIKFGSEEKLQNEYVCRACQKELRESKE